MNTVEKIYSTVVQSVVPGLKSLSLWGLGTSSQKSIDDDFRQMGVLEAKKSETGYNTLGLFGWFWLSVSIVNGLTTLTASDRNTALGGIAALAMINLTEALVTRIRLEKKLSLVSERIAITD